MVFTFALFHMAMVGIHQVTDLVLRLCQVLHICPQRLVSLCRKAVYTPWGTLRLVCVPA